MSALDLLRFSAGALTGHRLRAGLSLLGVAIGVAAVVLLTSLGEGARTYVVGEFSNLGTNLVIFLPGKTETTGVAPILGGSPRDLTVEDARNEVRTYAGTQFDPEVARVFLEIDPGAWQEIRERIEEEVRKLGERPAGANS